MRAKDFRQSSFMSLLRSFQEVAHQVVWGETLEGEPCVELEGRTRELRAGVPEALEKQRQEDVASR